MDVLLDTPAIHCEDEFSVHKISTDAYIHQYQHQQNVSHMRTFLEHVSELDIDHEPAFVRQTSIGCTLGEAWNDDEKIKRMIHGGMNILRLNLCMGTREYYVDAINRVRAIEESLNYNPAVAIALDLSAPPVRSGLINNDVDAVIELKDGQFIKLTTNEKFKDKTNQDVIWIDSQYFPSVLHCVSPGDRIYLDDSMLSLIVRNVTTDSINCLVEQGGQLGSWKRVEFPSERTYQKTFETTYMLDLAFAAECGVDYVFTGYASNRTQLQRAKEVLGPNIMLFAKLETKESIRNFNEVLAVADGIIVNRGGLGLTYATEKIFKLQKQIIAKCNVVCKPVFVISQLLESMRFKPRATRAEISDVANAVIDGADSLILTVETSRGLHPREALRVLHKTCREAESAVYHEKLWSDLKSSRDCRGLSPMNPAYITALAAVEASSTSNTSAIFVVTTTGRSAIAVASFRPFCPVVAIMRRPEVARVCHSARGVHPFVFNGDKLSEWSADMDFRLNAAINFARDRGFVADNDKVIIVTGREAGPGTTNTVRVMDIAPRGKQLHIISSETQLTNSNQLEA